MCLSAEEFPGEMFETLQTRLEEVFGEGGKTRAQELETVFENQVLAKGEGQLFLHPLANHPDLHPFEILQGQCDEVPVVAPEVMKKDGDFAGAAEADVAPFVCGAPVLPRDVIVVQTLSEWLVLKGW